MKTIIVNASPRKNWNTAQLLKEAQKGAESVGAATEYVDLYDLSFTGCRSCLACKLKNGKHPGCAWKDDLSPLIDRILSCDELIIGTPIYWGEPTAQFRALMERLLFCVVPYEKGSYFNGQVNVSLIYTMNAPQSYYENALRPYLDTIEGFFKNFLHGEVRSYAACDTLQVKDYSRYDMGYFDEAAKKAHREAQFPSDLAACFELGQAGKAAAEESKATSEQEEGGFFITDACIGCGTCAEACPGGCISADEVPCVIDQAQCLRCGTCMDACPVGAIEKR
jgi:multimeric flavodoxin WrbA